MKKISTLFILSILFLFSFSQELEELSFYPINGTFGITSQEDQLYLSNGDIIDISDPFNPTLLSQISISGQASSIIIEGDYAYYGTGMSNTLHIVDISNLSFPLVLSSHPFIVGNGVFGMAIRQDVLFLVLGSGGILCSMDISDKNNPSIIQTMTIPGGQCRDIIIKDQYAYAAHGGGLKVIDISDPSNMQIINSIGNGYGSIDIDGDLVCLGKSEAGVDIFDISSPTNPSPHISIPNSSGTAWSVKIKNHFVYLATNSNGLYVYKLGENSYLEMDQFHAEGNGQTFDVCLNDSLILLPGLVEGVSILAFDTLNFVAITEHHRPMNLRVSPNPLTSYISIDAQDHIIESIRIYNLKGELINELFAIDPKSPIDLSYLSSGIYTITIKALDGTHVEKIIKI